MVASSPSPVAFAGVGGRDLTSLISQFLMFCPTHPLRIGEDNLSDVMQHGSWSLQGNSLRVILPYGNSVQGGEGSKE